jgi:HEAT repeat protein
MDIESLRIALESNEIEKVESLLGKLDKQRNYNAIPILIEYLRSTQDHNLRNSIAITLRDIGSVEAVEPLIEMLNHPKTLGNRGSLLYALEPFDCSQHIETLVHHLITGNFEVQLKAYHLIEGITYQVKDESLLKSIIMVKNALDELERQQEILSETLDNLLSLKKI